MLYLFCDCCNNTFQYYNEGLYTPSYYIGEEKPSDSQLFQKKLFSLPIII